MSTYRFTRSELYRNDCPGRDDVGARQGHYVEADSAQEARQKLQKDFPDETLEQDQREGAQFDDEELDFLETVLRLRAETHEENTELHGDPGDAELACQTRRLLEKIQHWRAGEDAPKPQPSDTVRLEFVAWVTLNPEAETPRTVSHDLSIIVSQDVSDDCEDIFMQAFRAHLLATYAEDDGSGRPAGNFTVDVFRADSD